MLKIKLVDDMEIIEGEAIHITILIGKKEHIAHIGVSMNQDDYNYTIGYIDEDLSDHENDYVEKFIEENKRGIINMIRGSI